MKSTVLYNLMKWDAILIHVLLPLLPSLFFHDGGRENGLSLVMTGREDTGTKVSFLVQWIEIYGKEGQPRP